MKIALMTLGLSVSLIVVGCGDNPQNIDQILGTGGTGGTGGAATGGTGGNGTGGMGTGGTGGVTQIQETTIVGTLTPYSPGGGDLFPSGSVQAHWYQWDGFYVVLYRGFDASAGNEICAGNSILSMGSFVNVSNAPFIGAASEICVGAPKIADPPAGVFSCGRLLYYRTEIPTSAVGNLFGTLEIGTSMGFNGQTTLDGTPSDIANTPEFEPGLTAYELPNTTVDSGGVVMCP